MGQGDDEEQPVGQTLPLQTETHGIKKQAREEEVSADLRQHFHNWRTRRTNFTLTHSIRKLMDGRGGNEKVTGVSDEVVGLVY